MAAEIAHIGNAEAYQLDSVAFAVFRTEWVSPVEAFFGELVAHELPRSSPILRYGGSKFVDEKS